jgi:hypothetical protein
MEPTQKRPLQPNQISHFKMFGGQGRQTNNDQWVEESWTFQENPQRRLRKGEKYIMGFKVIQSNRQKQAITIKKNISLKQQHSWLQLERPWPFQPGFTAKPKKSEPKITERSIIIVKWELVSSEANHTIDSKPAIQIIERSEFDEQKEGGWEGG